MKPSPANAQELYLGSLEAIGLDVHAHDIRFVEDDWESPTLGAWGLGWEVWCDGMEISQFTYFQQVGGIECNPVPLELTYGLERMAMFIQGIENVYDLDWDGVPKRRAANAMVIFSIAPKLNSPHGILNMLRQMPSSSISKMRRQNAVNC